MDSRRVLLVSAALQGKVDRWARGHGEGATTVYAVRTAIDCDADPGGYLAAAVDDMRATTKEFLSTRASKADHAAVLADALIRAAATAVDDDTPGAGYVRRLYELCGADMAAAKQWRQDHPPKGFHPPQADPALHRSGS